MNMRLEGEGETVGKGRISYGEGWDELNGRCGGGLEDVVRGRNMGELESKEEIGEGGL